MFCLNYLTNVIKERGSQFVGIFLWLRWLFISSFFRTSMVLFTTNVFFSIIRSLFEMSFFHFSLYLFGSECVLLYCSGLTLSVVPEIVEFLHEGVYYLVLSLLCCRFVIAFVSSHFILLLLCCFFYIFYSNGFSLKKSCRKKPFFLSE